MCESVTGCLIISNGEWTGSGSINVFLEENYNFTIENLLKREQKNHNILSSNGESVECVKY